MDFDNSHWKKHSAKVSSSVGFCSSPFILEKTIYQNIFANIIPYELYIKSMVLLRNLLRYIIYHSLPLSRRYNTTRRL